MLVPMVTSLASPGLGVPRCYSFWEALVTHRGREKRGSGVREGHTSCFPTSVPLHMLCLSPVMPFPPILPGPAPQDPS